MLFDLRGRGRRRVVQAIYLTLAILMGGGLVLFGIGGNTEGGLLNAFSGDDKSGNEVIEKRVEQAQAAVRARPQDARAYAELTRAQYQSAEFDQNTGAFTDDGKQALREAERTYERYLKLAGDKPDGNIASIMSQAFSPAGLNKPDKAVSAWEIVVENREATAPLYVQLAALAYTAGQTRKGELAADKALELAPKDDREQIKAQLDAIKAQSSQQSADPTATSTTTTPSS